VFGKVFEFLIERYFDRDREEPRVKVSLSSVGIRSEIDPASKETRRVIWTAQLLLSNEALEPAADIRFLGKPPFSGSLPYHLGRYEDKTVPVKWEGNLEAAEAAADMGPEVLTNLLPAELRRPELVLAYRDERGNHFHTLYRCESGRETSEFRRELPAG
jgi:hypothetical protein